MPSTRGQMRGFLRLADGAGGDAVCQSSPSQSSLFARYPFGSGYHPGANGFPMLSPLSGDVSVPTVRWTDFRRGPANLLIGIRPGDTYASQMTANEPKPTRLNRMQPCVRGTGCTKP